MPQPDQKHCVTLSIKVSFFCLLLIYSCSSKKNSWIQLSGNTQGTTYSIVYEDAGAKNYASQIDSILNQVDLELSTYRADSKISAFNKAADTSFVFDQHSFLFKEMCAESFKIQQQTGGYFMPSVGPMIDYFYKVNDSLFNKAFDSLNVICHDIQYHFQNDELTSISKTKVESSLNFNAIAQGYSCDLIALFFKQKNISNFMIEIGGEVLTNGKNKTNLPWNIGVDKPVETQEQRALQLILSIDSGAVATSGSYRNYKIKNNQKYAHILNPKTGHPIAHNTLSVTVYHPNSCALADAYATAFMSMGKERALLFLEKNNHLNLSAYFIFDQNAEFKTQYSTSFKRLIKREISN